MTMAEIAAQVGNCDPIPAVPHPKGYTHSWSQPGYTISVLFGQDNKAIRIFEGSTQVGGPPTPGLLARRASPVPAAPALPAAPAPAAQKPRSAYPTASERHGRWRRLATPVRLGLGPA
jgi:hypothetical protein